MRKKTIKGIKKSRDERVTISPINQEGELHETGKIIQRKRNARSRSRGEKINGQGSRV